MKDVLRVPGAGSKDANTKSEREKKRPREREREGCPRQLPLATSEF